MESASLSAVLRDNVRHPLALLRDWNWKAAAFSAVLRAAIFLVANRHATHHAALKASVTELVYATIAAGIAGSVVQKLRHAEPAGQTALFVWLLLPLLMTAAQYDFHRLMRTPHLRASLVASFVFSAFASGFNWFAMRRGAFVTGADRSFARDLALVPKLIAQFLLAPFRRAGVGFLQGRPSNGGGHHTS